jgi:hypothetical protein
VRLPWSILAWQNQNKTKQQFFFSHLFIQQIDKSFSIMAELVDNPLGLQPDFHRVSQAHRNLADEMQKFPNIPQLNAVDTILAAINEKHDIVVRRLDRLERQQQIR